MEEHPSPLLSEMRNEVARRLSGCLDSVFPFRWGWAVNGRSFGETSGCQWTAAMACLLAALPRTTTSDAISAADILNANVSGGLLVAELR